MTRQTFVRYLSGWCGAYLTVPLFLEACAGAAFLSLTTVDGKLSVPKADLGERTAAILQAPDLPAPVFLTRTAAGDFEAVLMECTHRRCELRPVGNELHCPCHGSEFTADGTVLNGPAERPLRRFSVSTDEQRIYLQ